MSTHTRAQNHRIHVKQLGTVSTEHWAAIIVIQQCLSMKKYTKNVHVWSNHQRRPIEWIEISIKRKSCGRILFMCNIFDVYHILLRRRWQRPERPPRTQRTASLGLEVSRMQRHIKRVYTNPRVQDHRTRCDLDRHTLNLRSFYEWIEAKSVWWIA